MESIEQFIDNFRTREIDDNGEDSEEVIRHLFMSGYCYYFALMLQDAYPSGEICLAYPFGHIVYLYEGVPYDVEGVYSGKSDEFIPIKYLGNGIDDFRHIPDLKYNMSKDELNKIHARWLRDKDLGIA